MEHPGPTFASEFRRGLNAFNLTVGTLTSLATGALVHVGMSTGWVPDLMGRGVLWQSVFAACVMMVLTTGLHTAAHSYFGWRFERGIRAHHAGEHEEAVRLLAAVEGREMDHYDPDGHALAALQGSRAELA